MRRLDINLNRSIIQIRAYQPGRLLINDQEFNESIIVTPKGIITGWGVNTVSQLTADSLQSIIDLEADILLIGTGPAHHLIQSNYGDILKTRSGVEIMSTGAACRTFNALILEERSVVAALIVS